MYINRLKNYFFTIKSLKIKQVFYRLKLYVFGYNYRSFKGVESKDFSKSILIILSSTKPRFPIKKFRSCQSKDCFKFIGLERKVSSWNDEKLNKLWLYNLHYFDYINQNDMNECLSDLLISDWVNNSQRDWIGCEVYPTSVRVVNWIKYYINTGKICSSDIYKSLYIQSYFVSDNIEYHILGNHLFANAKALIFSGVFFYRIDDGKLLDKGLVLLDAELDEQILPDGGHFELSPMYHCLILEDLLDIYNLLSNYYFIRSKYIDLKKLNKIISNMTNWIYYISNEQNRLPRFNDCSDDIYESPLTLLNYAENQISWKKPINDFDFKYFKDSGYLLLKDESYFLIVDVGNIGPRYVLGHAHADTMSLELSYCDVPLFVNTGTSLYESGKRRLLERGTDSHNSAVIEGRNSSEIWSSFRVARTHSTPCVEIMQQKKGGTKLVASHDGYRKIYGLPVHKRSLSIYNGNLNVIDSFDKSCSSIHVNYHLHPNVIIEKITDSLIVLKSENFKFSMSVENHKIEVQEYLYAYSFGNLVSSKRIKIIKNNDFSSIEMNLTKMNC